MRLNIPALLLASSLLPATALATPLTAADVPPSTVRITTGVSRPVLLNGSQLSIPTTSLAFVPTPVPEMELSLLVNEKGVPSDVRVVKSVNPKVDAEVLAAARAFRFRPAMLDHQPVAMNMHVRVIIQR